MDMQELANKFQKEHRGMGRIVKVNSYSFVHETLPDKNGNTKQTVCKTRYGVPV